MLHTKSAPESSDFHRQNWYFGQRHLGYVLDIKMEHKAKLQKLVVLPLSPNGCYKLICTCLIWLDGCVHLMKYRMTSLPWRPGILHSHLAGCFSVPKELRRMQKILSHVILSIWMEYLHFRHLVKSLCLCSSGNPSVSPGVWSCRKGLFPHHVAETLATYSRGAQQECFREKDQSTLISWQNWGLTNA